MNDQTKPKRKREEAVQCDNGQPFWNETTELESSKLWLPHAPDRTPVGKTSALHRTSQGSWSTIRSWAPKKAVASTNPVWQMIADHAAEPPRQKAKIKEESVKTKKLRLFPDGKATRTLKKWMGAARFTYNRCLEAVKNGAKRSMKALRSACINKEILQREPRLAWLMETPYDIRDEAMRDLLKAYKAAQQHKHYKMKFRSRKAPQQTICIPHKHWGQRGVYAFLTKIRAEQKLPAVVDHDMRLTMTRLGEFYLCITVPLDVRPENQGPPRTRHSVIALDPGVRTFVTGYDADGRVVEWAANDNERIYRLCHSYDRLTSKLSKTPARRHGKQRVRREMWCIQRRIRNLVDDMHRRLARWLCESYRVVLLPKFETSKMVRRGQRRLSSKSARAMYTWSHYRFRQHLLHKAREHPWCHVVLCTEEYTSKTCGRCGRLHPSLGANKTFDCPHCGVVIDRDFNAARNVLLLYLTRL
eukprot:TRINITY_DN286_c0_g3_i2.p1 TRINITY_DN286_c0_g3~~TRINITY_DN286_c0_g3_i2.p1  ORF type:complete len:472 (+),score=37.26 TRINITY_DN286_c0_g3_i2:976-2391(+)